MLRGDKVIKVLNAAAAEDAPPKRATKADYGRHEVLHMASFLCNAVDKELCEHKSIKKDKEFSKLAHKACRALTDLYQAIGTKHL